MTIVGVETHRRRHEIREQVGVRDVLDFHLHLARRLRQIAQQLLEQRRKIAVHRNELFRLFCDVGKLDESRRHVRLGLHDLVDAEDVRSRDDAAQRSVRNLEHLLNRTDRADATNVVGTRIFGIFVFENDETNRLAFAQRFLDECDTRLLHDRKRNDGVREQHRLLQRQNAERIGCRESGRGHIVIFLTVTRSSVRSACGSRTASGSVIVRMPLLYVALASSTSVGPGSGMRAENSPYSISF